MTQCPGRKAPLPVLARCALVPVLQGAVVSVCHGDVLNLSWDNDLLTGTDQGYTNGVRLSWLGEPAERDRHCRLCLAGRARNLLAPLPGVGAPGTGHSLSFSVRQLMVTPEDIESVQPRYDDLPYVGYLSVSSTLWSTRPGVVTGYGVHLGVVGEDSGAEAVQRWAHKVVGSTQPAGWDHQLGTDVVGGVQAQHAERLALGRLGGWQYEASVMTGGRLSTFSTSLDLGLVFRIGSQLPDNLIPDYSGSASTIGLPGALGRDGWSVFLGVGGQYIPYSYLEAESGPYRFDQKPLVGQVGLGASWQAYDWLVSVILRATTDQEQSNKSHFSYGTLALSWRI
ncbi:lipid A deacylase LpxR family protein [Marinobacter lutaoensis]|uniref:lipid A deacylase LpxR family protein n=1 Tax=Marinobacter lutaoensis TaxID=135739 RepID=UPI0011159874|nr:lipid A deacylase LpxR family protein [Marinobacter lutaoensis]